jgi:hypothetical protein
MSDSWRRSYCSHSNWHRQAILHLIAGPAKRMA